MSKRITWMIVSLLLIASLVLVACGPEATATPEPTATEAPAEEPTEAPAEEPTEAPAEEPTEEPTEAPAAGEFEGETVNVIATWGGEEQDSFMAMVAPWEEATGATVAYEGTRDLNAILTTRVEGGNPPHIAGIPGPAVLRQFAEDGYLVDLSTFLDMDQLQEAYAQGWLDLGSFEGSLYGMFTKIAIKSLIWYSPPNFSEAGYEFPETWSATMDLTQQIADTGTTPWCVGLESGAASGWPGTDWIEDFMLRTAGPDLYDQWVEHEIPWTHDAVRNAWEMFGEIVTNPDYVYNGPTGVVATNFGEAPYPMFQDPPGCYLHRQATFISGFITDQFPDLQPVDDFAFFAFPPVDEQYGTPILSAGDLFGMFDDTPAARSLMEWLVSADAQRIWAERGGFISPNNNVPADVYPSALVSRAVELYQSADFVRFDASDRMPSAVNDAFWSGILEYVQNPDQLDSILQSIEDTAATAYGDGG